MRFGISRRTNGAIAALLFSALAGGIAPARSDEAPAVVALMFASMAGRGPAAGSDDASARVVTRFYDGVVAVMRSGRPTRARFDALKPGMLQTFDVPAMAQKVVGHNWTAFAPETRKQFQVAYADFVVATYARRLDNFSGERFEVEPASEKQGNGRLVYTKIIDSEGVPHAVNYMVGQDAKVYDTYFDGTISDVASRRAEFAALLSKSGPDQLVAILVERTVKLLDR